MKTAVRLWVWCREEWKGGLGEGKDPEDGGWEEDRVRRAPPVRRGRLAEGQEGDRP